MNLIQRELPRTILKNVPRRFYRDGVPVLCAFGCALLERDTGKSVVYTGAKEMLRRQVAIPNLGTAPFLQEGCPE